MRRLVFASLLFLVAGCGSTDAGYAVDFTLVVDSNVPITDLTTLRFSVSGAENDARDIPVAGKFASREETLRYKPAATTVGTLDFAFNLVDRNGQTVAVGSQPGVIVEPGSYQKFRVALSERTDIDLGIPEEMNRCGNGTVDPDEMCDPASPSGCPTSVADCDDQNDCTTDSFAGSGCQAACTHTPANNSNACMIRAGDAGVSGVCLNGQCCTGCIKSGQCKPGDSNARECGSGGNDCFDCTANSATATCNAGTCSGCDATSCTTDGRTCGTSSCGYNCGGCPDVCAGAGVVTKYACVNKTCQPNGGGNCGLYATCSGTVCSSQCVADQQCVSTAACVGGVCKPKSSLGGPCSREGADNECFAPNVCTWAADGVSAICAPNRCTGCSAPDPGNNYACTGGIAYGKDPRDACPYVNVCNDGVCNGYSSTYAACAAPGEGPGGTPKPCGTTSCSNTAAGGFGQMTGAICNGATCVANTTVACRQAVDGAPYDLCQYCAGNVCDPVNRTYICN